MSIKIAVIGVGSFVFGPSFLHDVIVEQRLAGAELALIDVNAEVLDLMAGVGRRMAEQTGVAVKITTHTDRAAGLVGADFVVCAAAVQMQARFRQDVDIIRRRDPNHLITEFGGLSGIASSLRQIAMIEGVVADMKRHAPKAMLLTVSNPLPRVAQAAHQLGVRTVGFCSNSMQGYGLLDRLTTGNASKYPWPTTTAKYEMVMAGVNHLTFTLQILDRQTGADVQPPLIEDVRAGRKPLPGPITRRLVLDTGMLATNGDGHMHDFLPPQEGSHSMDSTSHGTADEREQRLRMLRDVAEGRASYQTLLDHRAWERPADLIAALATNRPAHFHSLNLINDVGQIPQLPRHVFVETPATADAAGIKPRPCDLPDPAARYCRPTAELHDTIVQAALGRSVAKLHEAVDRDPTITDKPLGRSVMQDLLTAHADLTGTYR